MSTKTNKEGITYIAECLDMTLMRFITCYITSDEFADMVDNTIKEINPRRIENGLEELDVNSLLVDLAEQK
jgi:phosphopantetheine adenylyltransferase